MGNRGGVLVCGVPRSGTSLVRGFLACHPAFATPRHEMAWWVTLYPRFRRRPARWEAFLAALTANHRTHGLGLDPAQLAAALAAVPPGAHLQAFAQVLASYADARGRPRWAEKTPLAEVYAQDVLATVPGTAVIHLVRDPRDVCASYLHAPWRARIQARARNPWARARITMMGHPGWLMRNWRTSVRLARIGAQRYPERYRVVRYEDLVADPPGQLAALCAFLDEPYDERMLVLDAFPDLVARRGNSSFGPVDGVSSASVGRYATVLPRRVITLCEDLAGDDLERMEYARSGITLSRTQAWRLRGVDRPLAAIVGGLHEAAFQAEGVPR